MDLVGRPGFAAAVAAGVRGGDGGCEDGEEGGELHCGVCGSGGWRTADRWWGFGMIKWFVVVLLVGRWV